MSVWKSTHFWPDRQCQSGKLFRNWKGGRCRFGISVRNRKEVRCWFGILLRKRKGRMSLFNHGKERRGSTRIKHEFFGMGKGQGRPREGILHRELTPKRGREKNHLRFLSAFIRVHLRLKILCRKNKNSRIGRM